MTPYYDDGCGIVLYLGDCREVLPELAADSIDAVVTDPPYARDVYQRAQTRTYGWNHPYQRQQGAPPADRERLSLSKLAAGAIGSVDALIEPCALEFARLVRRWCLVFSDAESLHRWRAALEEAGLRYVRTGAWIKPDPLPQMSGVRPAVGFEPCTIAHAKGAMRWNGGGHAAIWTHNTVKGNAKARPDHPCVKPLALMQELVTLFTDPGETILDPFAGSGTTLLAARNLGRRAIGIELSERYAEVAARRLASPSGIPHVQQAPLGLRFEAVASGGVR